MNKKLTLQDKAIRAIKEAVKEAIDFHLMAGRPIAVWKDGKVQYISRRHATSKAPTSRKRKT